MRTQITGKIIQAQIKESNSGVSYASLLVEFNVFCPIGNREAMTNLCCQTGQDVKDSWGEEDLKVFLGKEATFTLETTEYNGRLMLNCLVSSVNSPLNIRKVK